MENIRTMSEREWDIKRITETLKTSGEPVSDFMRGEGVALSYPSSDAKLELYPEKFAVRYRAGYLRIDMNNVIGLSANKNGVQITAGPLEIPTLLTLRPDGSINVAIKKANKLPAKPETDQVTTLVEAPSPAGTATEEGKSSHIEPAAEKDRVTLTGRVGRTPSSRTTPNGRLVVRVPLAVHEGQETKWHQLVFFDDLGKKVAESVRKGELVNVIGYRHIREVSSKDGGNREVEEIYGATLQIRRQ